MSSLTEEVQAVAQASFHTAKYGVEWTRADHERLFALLRRVGQEAAEEWLQAVGFRVYVVLRAVPGSTTGVLVVGVASSRDAALALSPGADWRLVEGGGRLLAYSTEGHLSCWELMIGGAEEMNQWTFCDV